MEKSHLWILGCIISLSFFNSSFYSSAALSQTSTPQYGGCIIDCADSDAGVLNPLLANDTDIDSKKIIDLVFEPLITYDKDKIIVPLLALKWITSLDRLSVTFCLRDDVYWHDGVPFTADDVVFTWLRIMDNRTSLSHPELANYLNPTLPIQKIDDHHVIFYLTNVCSVMLDNLMVPIIPCHAYKNTDSNCTTAGFDEIIGTTDDGYTFNTDPRNYIPIGTGSMMFSKWIPNNQIVLVRNCEENVSPIGTLTCGGYWKDHNAYLDQYILKIIPQDKQLDAFKNAEIDMLDLSNIEPDIIDQFTKDPSIHVISSPTQYTEHIAFQCDPDHGYKGDQNFRNFTLYPNRFAGFEWQVTQYGVAIVGNGYLVRKAINYAIDKTALIDFAYPFGSRNLSPLFVNMEMYGWGGTPPNPYDFDLDVVNQLLNQAGYGSNNTASERQLLNFTISYDAGNIHQAKICYFVQQRLAVLGIDLRIHAIDHEQYFSTTQDFDMLVNGCVGPPNPYVDLVKSWSSSAIRKNAYPVDVATNGSWVWSSSSELVGLNYMAYWNPTVDGLFATALQENESVVLKNYYNMIQEYIVEDSPYVWLLRLARMVAIDAQFHGFVDNSFIGIWAEPSGFYSIYYIPLGTSDLSQIVATPGFTLFSVLISLLIVKNKFK